MLVVGQTRWEYCTNVDVKHDFCFPSVICLENSNFIVKYLLQSNDVNSPWQCYSLQGMDGPSGPAGPAGPKGDIVRATFNF